ncbi:MAG: ABC-type Mn2+/Zn2+ transport system, periplasmic component protein [Herbaspirillum sp.]|jgi:zinc/manganese transport system substrate-binding protein|nr:ABC-type Mn2+/Zn2+ transport system, periplasmic component protein [Herbaspirillum sp.]
MFSLRGLFLTAGLAVGLMFTSVAGAAEKLPVVASFSILGDIVAQVGGDRIAVSALVGPDQDAHVYEPTPDDIKKVAHAKLVVVNGLGFEGWLDRLAHAAGYKGVIVVASHGVNPREMLEEDHAEHTDPHAWQDPENIIVYTGNIVAALSKLDPAGARVYKKNGDAYIAALKQLDAWTAAQIATIPAGKRKIITSHDAFHYFGAHYNIEFIAPQGMATDSEPSAQDVAAMIRQMKTERIKAVFIENMTSPKLLEQIARDAGVAPGGKLYSDALSGPGGVAPDYLTMMRYNVAEILAGLRKN